MLVHVGIIQRIRLLEDGDDVGDRSNLFGSGRLPLRRPFVIGTTILHAAGDRFDSHAVLIQRVPRGIVLDLFVIMNPLRSPTETTDPGRFFLGTGTCLMAPRTYASNV